MKKSSAPPRRRARKPNRHDLQADTSDQEYRVGPGRPPKEYQFKPGQSGNPEGVRRKPRSIAPDLKALFERALSTKVTLRQGEKERIISKAAAGIEQLVNQFAKGDRHARRDLLILAQTLGVDLAAGEGDIGQAVASALSVNDEALLADYVGRHSAQAPPGHPERTPVTRNPQKVAQEDRPMTKSSHNSTTRERFYHAESLRNFARDTVPEGTFDALKDEVYHGVVDVCEGAHPTGFERMRATVTQAAQVAVTSNPLAPATKAQDRQGICHQLANDDRLIWVPDHD